MIKRIEDSLLEDLQSVVFTHGKRGTDNVTGVIGVQDSAKLVKGRRRSTGNVSISHFTQLMRQNDCNNLNESGQNTSTEKDGKPMTHSQ